MDFASEVVKASTSSMRAEWSANCLKLGKCDPISEMQVAEIGTLAGRLRAVSEGGNSGTTLSGGGDWKGGKPDAGVSRPKMEENITLTTSHR